MLADGFFEWKGARGSKTPNRIKRVDDEPFAFAGLWETWSSNGDMRETVTIITTEPNKVMEPIHNRMPVILEQNEEEAWIEEEDRVSFKQFSINIRVSRQIRTRLRRRLTIRGTTHLR